MSSSSSISIGIAALQLLEVQDVLNAIQKADATTAIRLAAQAFAHKNDRTPDQYASSSENTRITHKPGKVIQGLPIYPRGKVFHMPARYVYSAPIVDSKPAAVPHLTAAPPPPWKMPLPVGRACSTIVIKEAANQPDVITKGTLIDLFV